MKSTRRDLIGYAEFLRDAGNLYLEATPEQQALLEALKPAPPAAKPAPAARAAAAPHSAPPRASAAMPPPPKSQPVRPMPKPAAPTPADLVQMASASATFEGPPLGREERTAKMEAAKAIVAACRKCERLCGRTQSVYGVGDPMAKIVFVGEAPGAEEDRTGIPFVGRAGQLLTKMIEAIGFSRDEVYICNTLKCRPPENAAPLPGEKKNCEPFLLQQLDLIRPQLLVALGAHAAGALTGKEGSLGQLRKGWHAFHGIPLMVTYHPSFLLRPQGQSFKPLAWEDLQKLYARFVEFNPDDKRKVWEKGASGGPTP